MKRIIILFLFFNFCFIELKSSSTKFLFTDQNSPFTLEDYKRNKKQKRLLTPDSKGNTSLEKAILEGNVDKIYSLLKQAGDLSYYINESGKNLYHHLFATQFEKIKEGIYNTKDIPTAHKKNIIQYISRFNLELNLKNSAGYTPASYAVLNNSLEDLQILKELERGENRINLELKIQGNNLMHLAALHHSPKVVRFLLNHSKLNINEKNHQGKTAIFIAAELLDPTGHRSLMREKPKDPIVFEAKNHNIFLRENHNFILELMNEVDLYRSGTTNNVFEALARTKKYSLFEYLFKREMNKKSFKELINKSSHRLAHIVINPEFQKPEFRFPYELRNKFQAVDVNFLQLLRLFNFSISHQIGGESPLRLSILKKQALTNIFLIHNSDLQDLNKREFLKTHAMMAVELNLVDTFKALYDKGVDLSIKEDGLTPPHKAVEKKHIHIIEVFSKDPSILSLKNDRNISVLDMIKNSRWLSSYFSIDSKKGILNKTNIFPKRKLPNSNGLKVSPRELKLERLPLLRGRR